jgi:TetR/AcrR family transcriptional repressor of nem operon
MARHREFDSDSVVRRAMEAFWSRGYEATSIADLVDETQVARGSLYGAFGDKRELFRAALERYDAERFALLKAELERPGPVRRVMRDWLVGAAKSCAGEDGRRGCLIYRAASEVAPGDPEIARWLRGVMRRNERLIASVLERGKKDGELRKGLDSAAAARLLLTSIAGLKTLGQFGQKPAEAREVVDQILKVLD